MPALRARVLVAQGELAAALAWARQHGLSADDELTYLREYEHVTLARVLLAEHAATARTALRAATGCSTGCSPPPRPAAGPAPSSRSWCCGRPPQPLRRRVAPRWAPSNARSALAEPEGYVRVFARRGRADGRAARCGWSTADRSGATSATSSAAAAAPGTERRRPGPPLRADVLVDPLSERELDVLRLLATDLDGPSIARQLVVSLNTVRTHTKHIYAKLGVNNRRAAVSRARSARPAGALRSPRRSPHDVTTSHRNGS